jgi:hypothetical protein
MKANKDLPKGHANGQRGVIIGYWKPGTSKPRGAIEWGGSWSSTKDMPPGTVLPVVEWQVFQSSSALLIAFL